MIASIRSVLQDLRLGSKLARRSLLVDALSWGLTGLGIAATIIALMVATSLPVLTESYTNAVGRRTPILDDHVPGAREAVGIETLDGRTYTRVVVTGVDTNSPRPPGVSTWPAPHQSVVSPALKRALDADPQLSARLALGTVNSSVIEPAGLTAPDELRSYSVRPGRLQTPGIVGYGGPSTAQVQTPISMGLFEVVTLVVLPALILMAVSLRSIAARRRQRYGGLVILGVSPRRCARLFAYEVSAVACVSICGGLVVFWLGQPVLAPTGTLGLTWWPETLAPSLGTLAIAALCSTATMAVIYRGAALAMRLTLSRPLRRQSRRTPQWVTRTLAIASRAAGIVLAGAACYLVMLALRAAPGVKSAAGTPHYAQTLLVVASVAGAGVLLIGAGVRWVLVRAVARSRSVSVDLALRLALSRWPSAGRLTEVVAGLVLVATLANTFVVWVGAVVHTAGGDRSVLSVSLNDLPANERQAIGQLSSRSYEITTVAPPQSGQQIISVSALHCGRDPQPECAKRGSIAPSLMASPPHMRTVDGKSRQLDVRGLMADPTLTEAPRNVILRLEDYPWMTLATEAELQVTVPLSEQSQAIADIHRALPTGTVQTSDDQDTLQLAREQQLILRAGVTTGMLLCLAALLIVTLDHVEHSRRANNQLLATGVTPARLRTHEALSVALPLAVSGLFACTLGSVCSWGLLSLFGKEYVTAGPIFAGLAPFAMALILSTLGVLLRPRPFFDRSIVSV